MKILVIIEKTATGFSAYLPDIDGCVATGKTEAKTLQNIRTAIKFHLEGIKVNNEYFPQPLSHSPYIRIHHRDIHNINAPALKGSTRTSTENKVGA